MIKIDIKDVFDACQKLRGQPWVDWPLSLKVSLLFLASVLLFLTVNTVLFSDTAQTVTVNAQTIQSLQTKLAQQQAVINAVTENHVETKLLNFTDVISHIELLTKQHAIKIISIKPPGKIGTNLAGGESLQLVLSGSYEKLTTFIKALSNSQLNVSIKEFVLEKSHAQTPSEGLQLILDLYFYSAGGL